jgi:hypothetical protein
VSRAFVTYMENNKGVLFGADDAIDEGGERDRGAETPRAAE